MPNQFFDKFPIINYANNNVRNIFAKVVLDDVTKRNAENYLQIRTSDDVAMRGDIVADRYYGSSYFDWIHYISNDVIDPYNDCFLDSYSLEQKIAKKYGNVEYSKQIIAFYVNNWAQNPEDKLSIQQYESASKNIKKYYTASVDYANRIIEYVRHKKDWKKSTNKIRFLTLDTTEVMFVGTLVYQFVNDLQVATGQVTEVNDTDKIITVKNITGEFVSTTNVLYRIGFSKQYTVTAVSSPHIDDNITTEEARFWSPLSYYDYESELNELKRNIKIMRKEGVRLLNKNIEKLLE